MNGCCVDYVGCPKEISSWLYETHLHVAQVFLQYLCLRAVLQAR